MGRVRGCATLMVASKVTSEINGWVGERLCDFDGGFRSDSATEIAVCGRE